MLRVALKAGTFAALATVSLASQAQWVGLNNYTLVGSYTLPTQSPNPFSALEFEGSAVTWNKDTNTLFILGDGGGFVMQTTLTGTPVDFMRLGVGNSPQGNEFYDPEGLVYIGAGKFVLTEERYRTAVQFSYVAGSTLQRAQTQTVKLATTVGNTGLEGISTDPVTGGYLFVNQANGTNAFSGTNQNVFQTQIDFASGAASNGSASTLNNSSLFPVANIGYSNLNDVFALANVYASNVSGYDNVLVMTTTGVKEMTRAGVVAGSLALVGGYQFEGMTMDNNGRLYVVSDNGDTPALSGLFVYAPVPEPGTHALLLAGLVAVAGVARRRALRA